MSRNRSERFLVSTFTTLSQSVATYGPHIPYRTIPTVKQACQKCEICLSLFTMAFGNHQITPQCVQSRIPKLRWNHAQWNRRSITWRSWNMFWTSQRHMIYLLIYHRRRRSLFFSMIDETLSWHRWT